MHFTDQICTLDSDVVKFKTSLTHNLCNVSSLRNSLRYNTFSQSVIPIKAFPLNKLYKHTKKFQKLMISPKVYYIHTLVCRVI